MILGIDPGRDKIGWALATSQGTLILSGICPAPELEAFLGVLKHPADKWEKELAAWACERFFPVAEPRLEYVALGDGTGSGEIASRCAQLDLKIVHVDEEGTTIAARDLYWRFHRPALWQKCLPYSLRVPPRNIDDFAALAIVLRGIARSVVEMENIEEDRF
ncbi:MAG: endonuclease [Synergistaceae bacterium]|jgi:RNase H-fold protein (predicted Holliday junction resolvase)|nr:endonuclease [Synergistaceae bacterium]